MWALLRSHQPDLLRVGENGCESEMDMALALTACRCAVAELWLREREIEAVRGSATLEAG